MSDSAPIITAAPASPPPATIVGNLMRLHSDGVGGSVVGAGGGAAALAEGMLAALSATEPTAPVLGGSLNASTASSKVEATTVDVAGGAVCIAGAAAGTSASASLASNIVVATAAAAAAVFAGRTAGFATGSFAADASAA